MEEHHQFILTSMPLDDFESRIENAAFRGVKRAREPTPSDDGPDWDWLSNREAMQRLGKSRATLARWRKEGVLPFAKVGSSIFYRRIDLEAFLERHLQSN